MHPESGISKKALIFWPYNAYPPQTGAHQVQMADLTALRALGYQCTIFGSNLYSDVHWQLNKLDEWQTGLGAKLIYYPGDAIDRLFIERQNQAVAIQEINLDRYLTPGVKEAFEQAYLDLQPDLVVIYYAYWGRLAEKNTFRATPCILRSVDLLTVNDQMLRAVNPYLSDPVYPDLLDSSILDEAYYDREIEGDTDSVMNEYKIYDLFDVTVAISHSDSDHMQRNTQYTHVHCIPAAQEPQKIQNNYRGDPVFAASNYALNLQGYSYFAKRVLPLIRAKAQNFNLRMIGKACEHVMPVRGIQLLGFVPDLKPLYAESKFAICPLIGGTGMQVKIVEAMAHGVPVIVLKNVAKNSPVQHGVNGFVAEDAEQFAEYTLKLYNNPQLCAALGRAARQTILAQFSPDMLVTSWEKSILDAEAQQAKRLLSVTSSNRTLELQVIPAKCQVETRPKISIITPTYNCKTYLRDCIESVLAQNYENFEHIIVDGASDDGTIEVLKQYSHLKWFSEPDHGEAEALNKGLRLASGDIIGWLNADDYYLGGTFEAVAEEFASSAGPQFIYGKTVLIDDDGNGTHWIIPTSPVTPASLTRWWKLNLYQPSLFFSKEILEQTGFFSEDIHYGVDYEYWFRAISKGYPFRYLDRALSKARLWRSGGKSETPYLVKEREWLAICKQHLSLLNTGEQIHFWKDYYIFRMKLAEPVFDHSQLPEDLSESAPAIAGYILALKELGLINPGRVADILKIELPVNASNLFGLLGETLLQNGFRQDALEAFKWAFELESGALSRKSFSNEYQARIYQELSVSIALGHSSTKREFGFNIIGYISGNLGLGLLARNFMRALIEAGYPVRALDLDPSLGRGGQDHSLSEYLVGFPEELPYGINLFIVNPPVLAGLFKSLPYLFQGSYFNAALPMWELTVLPEKWIEILSKMDAIVAASAFVKENFEAYLPNTPVIFAPPPLYLPAEISPSRSKFGLPERAILFCSSFEPHSDVQRKNPFAVIEAFQQAFGHDSRVQLVININNAQVNGSLHASVARLQEKCSRYSNIKLIAKKLDYAGVLSLYSSCDVYVSLHRAEGLGLGMMEAMALGKPVIATGWSGNRTFMNSENSFLVDYSMIPVEGSIPAYQKEFLGVDTTWADANISTASDCMRKLFQEQELREQFGKKASADLSALQVAARRVEFVQTLGQISGYPLQELSPATARKLPGFVTIVQNESDFEAAVDIVIPIYGKADLLQQCIDSVLASTVNAHLILVDDYSPGDEIEKVFNDLRGKNKLTLVSLTQNQGFLGASRIGAELGKAPFLLFLNSDTRAIEGGWLERMIPAKPDIGVVGAKLIYPPELPGPLASSIQHGGVARNFQGIPYHPFLGWPANRAVVCKEREVNAVTGACMLIRRELWKALGGWDARFEKGIYEDVDFCWRVRQKGYKVIYQPEACLYHYESASTAPDGHHPLNAHVEENRRRLLEKWGSMESDEAIFFGRGTVHRWDKARVEIYKAQKANEQRNSPAAMVAIRRAVEIAPDYFDALVGYAQMLGSSGDHEKAIKYYRRALDIAPSAWNIRLQLVEEYLTLGQMEKAAGELIPLRQVFPNAPEVQNREKTLAAYLGPAQQQPSVGSSSAERLLQELLNSDDLASALEQNLAQLDTRLVSLVQRNAATARAEGNTELAEGLEGLAGYIEEIIRARDLDAGVTAPAGDGSQATQVVTSQSADKPRRRRK